MTLVTFLLGFALGVVAALFGVLLVAFWPPPKTHVFTKDGRMRRTMERLGTE